MTIENDRLINITDYLPTNYSGTQVHEFLKFFEDFLNYDLFSYRYDNDTSIDVSILKKIELLYTLRDPYLIDINIIQFFANYLGYNINYNRDNIGLISGVTTDDAINKYLRQTIQSMPHWYKLKTTNNSISMIMYMFGIVSDVYTLWTNNYENNWEIENPKYENQTIAVGMPSGYYPTPHFNVSINIDQTPVGFETNLSTIISLIESIKPVNTVFEGFTTQSRFTTTTDIIVNFIASSRIDTINDTYDPNS